MDCFSSRRDSHDARRWANAIAVRTLLAAFALLVAPTALLIPIAPANTGTAPTPPHPAVPRLHDALKNLRLRIEMGMLEAYDGWFHDAGERATIIEVFPGLDSSAGGGSTPDLDAAGLRPDLDAAS